MSGYFKNTRDRGRQLRQKADPNGVIMVWEWLAAVALTPFVHHGRIAGWLYRRSQKREAGL